MEEAVYISSHESHADPFDAFLASFENDRVDEVNNTFTHHPLYVDIPLQEGIGIEFFASQVNNDLPHQPLNFDLPLQEGIRIEYLASQVKINLLHQPLDVDLSPQESIRIDCLHFKFNFILYFPVSFMSFFLHMKHASMEFQQKSLFVSHLKNLMLDHLLLQ